MPKNDSKSNKKDKSDSNVTDGVQVKSRKQSKINWGEKVRSRPAVLLMVVAVLVLAAGFYILKANTNRVELVEPVTTDTIYQDTELTYRQRAEQLEFYDDYEGAQQLLQEGADNTQGNAVAEAEFYLKKGQLAINNGFYEDALEFGLKAEEANQTIRTAVLTAQSAERLGDKETAIKYYQLAVDRTPEEERLINSQTSEYPFYVNKIKSLSGADEN